MTNAQAQPYYDTRYNSYEPPQYPSDNHKYKSKDSKSINTNKIKCINTNLNINGNNTGDVNVGNKREGYLGANSYGGYYEGHNNNKQGKVFDDCIINNNNTNTNIVIVGGNVTDSNGNVTDTCEECLLKVLGPTRLTQLLSFLAQFGLDIAGKYCESLRQYDPAGLENSLGKDLFPDIASFAEVQELTACILKAFGKTTDNNGSLAPVDINTDTSGDFGPMMTLPTPSPSLQTFDR